MIDINKIDFGKMNGLIPAVIADIQSGAVLMLGYMNREAVEKSIESGMVTFYSRSRDRLWTKGETSGNYLKLRSISSDCDNDSLLIYAEPAGPVCHTGSYSCFENGMQESNFLYYLYDLVKKRKSELPEGSYTTKLFLSGKERIAQKVGEEGVETVIASMAGKREELIGESADLLFHLMVLLAEEGIEFSEIVQKLESRHRK